MAAEVEVYESEDLAEEDQHNAPPPQPERFDSEQIESVQLDVGAALQRFRGKFLSNTNSDFSDSTTGQKVRGFRGGGDSYVVELLGSRPEQESVQERYNRLRQEILELSNDVQAIKDAKENKEGGGGEAVRAEDVAGLEAELGRLDLEWVTKEAAAALGTEPGLSAKLAQSVETLRAAPAAEGKKAAGGKTADGVTYELAVAPRSMAAAKATQLEGRLARLEKALGHGSGPAPTEAVTGSGRGLRGSVEWLERRVELVEAGGLEAAEARLTALLAKLNSLKEMRDEGLQPDEREMVHELSEKLAKWDELGAALPEMVARLEALQELHLQALHFAQSLSQVDLAQKELGKTVDSNAELLKDAKHSVAENLAHFQALAKDVQAKVAK